MSSGSCTPPRARVYGTAQYEPIDEKHPLRAQSPYAASKIAADTMVEAYARSFGIRAVVLRPFNTYGPRQSERAVLPTIVRQALDPDRPTIALGDTSPRRDFTFVYDTVEAFASVGRGRRDRVRHPVQYRQRGRGHDCRARRQGCDG